MTNLYVRNYYGGDSRGGVFAWKNSWYKDTRKNFVFSPKEDDPECFDSGDFNLTVCADAKPFIGGTDPRNVEIELRDRERIAIANNLKTLLNGSENVACTDFSMMMRVRSYQDPQAKEYLSGEFVSKRFTLCTEKVDPPWYMSAKWWLGSAVDWVWTGIKGMKDVDWCLPN